MPQKSNHSCLEKYPYVRVGTLVSIRITDTLTKKQLIYFMRHGVLESEEDTYRHRI